MTNKIGDLKGPILDGKCNVVFFSQDDLDQLFENESDVAEWFANNSGSEDSFSSKDITFDGVNEYLLIRKEEKIICYSWNEANGPHPDRWQDTDDLTDWFSENL